MRSRSAGLSNPPRRRMAMKPWTTVSGVRNWCPASAMNWRIEVFARSRAVEGSLHLLDCAVIGDRERAKLVSFVGRDLLRRQVAGGKSL